MLIRKMTIEDVKQVAEIEAQCFSLPWSEKSFKDSLQREDTVFLVCENRISSPVLQSPKPSQTNCQAACVYEGAGLVDFALPFYNKENPEKLQNDSNLSDKIIIGYIGMYISFEEGEITNVAVLPSARQKGIGNALIEAIKEAAKKQKVQRIVLEVRASNQPAIALYEKSGFVSIGIRKNFYEKPVEDAKIMIFDVV